MDEGEKIETVRSRRINHTQGMPIFIGTLDRNSIFQTALPSSTYDGTC
jgi:hypothetical protein